MDKMLAAAFLALLSACQPLPDRLGVDPGSDRKPIITAQIGQQSVRMFQGEYVVEFKPGLSEEQRLRALKLPAKLPAMKLVQLYSQGRLALVSGNVLDEDTHQKVMTALCAKPEILAVEPNYVVESNSQNRLPVSEKLWALDNHGLYNGRDQGRYNADLNGREVLALNQNLNQLTVAIIDSGVDINHPDLRDNVWSNAGEIPGNQIDDDGNGYVDDHQGWNFYFNNNNVNIQRTIHGTHVAGIIGANNRNGQGVYGIAPGINMMMLPAGVTVDLSYVGVLAAFDYAIAQKARIINCSFTLSVKVPLLYQRVRKAWEQNITIVAATGNDGVNIEQSPRYPASYGEVIRVGASTSQDEIAGFSNYTSAFAPYMVAPGENIYSTAPGGYAWSSGTSMATPYVAGLAAQIISRYPAINPFELHRRLRQGPYVRNYPKRAFKPTRVDGYLAVIRPKNWHVSSYCTRQRQQNRPFANSAEPGIDGDSREKSYTLCNAAQLFAIRAPYMEKFFKLMADIDLSNYNYANLPGNIGGFDRQVQVFNGVFDGNRKFISHYRFDRPRFTGSGLFRQVGPQGSIERLGLYDVFVNGGEQTGALVGELNGRVESVWASGEVKGVDTVGGLVGAMRDPQRQNRFHFMIGSMFTGHVSGLKQIGGLIGRVEDDPIVLANYAGIDVSGDQALGGLIGQSDARQGHIYANYQRGKVTPRDDQRLTRYLGGLIGLITAAEPGKQRSTKIHSSYSDGYISANADAGGLVGTVKGVLDMENSLALGYVFGPEKGGLVASLGLPGETPGKVISQFSYWNRANGGDQGIGGEAKTPAQLKTISTYLPHWRGEDSPWIIARGEFPRLCNLPPETIFESSPLTISTYLSSPGIPCP